MIASRYDLVVVVVVFVVQSRIVLLVSLQLRTVHAYTAPCPYSKSPHTPSMFAGNKQTIRVPLSSTYHICELHWNGLTVFHNICISVKSKYVHLVLYQRDTAQQETDWSSAHQ